MRRGTLLAGVGLLVLCAAAATFQVLTRPPPLPAVMAAPDGTVLLRGLSDPEGRRRGRWEAFRDDGSLHSVST